ncbi:MAG: hypothetical protein ACUVV6_09535, partial [Thermoplasmatota archaeon]
MPKPTERQRVLAALVTFAMLGAIPWPAPAGADEAGAGPRAIVDDGSDLIVPQGESYELWGCHTYTNEILIEGVLKVAP